VITWQHIPACGGAGLDEQWQARMGGRSIAVFANVAGGGWRGIVIGPDTMVQDVEIVERVPLNAVMTEFERILGLLWEKADAEKV